MKRRVRICWYCGTRSRGKLCPCCDADLDAQEAELAALNAVTDTEPIEVIRDETETTDQ